MYKLLTALLLVLPWPLYWWFMTTFKNTKKNRINLVITRALDRIVLKNRLLIGEMDLFNNKIIGLDQKKNKLILIDYQNGSTNAACISLKNAVSCTFYKETNQYTNRIEKVVLQLTFSVGNKPASFTLYDASTETRYELPFLLGKAKYWKSKIQLCIYGVTPQHKLENAL